MAEKSISDLMGRLNNLHANIGGDVVSKFGGFLRCETCGSEKSLTGDDAGSYLAHGWPRCCGLTMRWWTQRQIDAGEVPARAVGDTP